MKDPNKPIQNTKHNELKMSQQYTKYNGRSYRIRQMYNGQNVFWTGYTAQDHARSLAIGKYQKPYPTVEYLGKKQRVYTHEPSKKSWYTVPVAARDEYLPEGGQYFYSNYTPEDHAKFLRGELIL